MARVMGIENELCLQAAGRTQAAEEYLQNRIRGANSLSVAGAVLEEIDASSWNWVMNGSKAYTDRAYMLEMAGAECGDAKELVALDTANMRWMGERTASIHRMAVDRSMPSHLTAIRVRAYKVNTDLNGHTAGTHENYLVMRESMMRGVDLAPEEARGRIFRHLADRIMPFLVTRQVFAGAGGIAKADQTSGNLAYTLSQRSFVMERAVDGSTTQNRPIMNTRDEPHADPRAYLRLHLICGDANMSQYATWLKAGTTSLVLSLIENGLIERCALSDPTSDIRAVNADLTGQTHLLRFEDGRSLSAIDVQKMYRDLVTERLLPRLDAGEREILTEWSRTIDDIAHAGPLELTDRLDHALKFQLLLSAQRRRPNRPLTATEVRSAHLNYHDISPGSIYPKLSRTTSHRIIDEGTIKYYGENPPWTRARGRTMLVRGLLERDIHAAVDWSAVHIGSGRLGSLSEDGTQFSMPHPELTYEEEAQEILDEIDERGRSL